MEEKTYMQAMLRMPTTASFVCCFIWSFRTRKIGRIPTVKSHKAAKALYTYVIAMMVSMFMQWPSMLGSKATLVQKYCSGLHCNSIKNMKTKPASTVKAMTM